MSLPAAVLVKRIWVPEMDSTETDYLAFSETRMRLTVVTRHDCAPLGPIVMATDRMGSLIGRRAIGVIML
jgi:hypothetical protein